jgi:serine/threonine protein kinase
MAPELFQDGSSHSSASDLWALGCVLYECAAGQPPFVSTSFNQLVQDILQTDPAPLPGEPLFLSDSPCVVKVVGIGSRQTHGWEGG